MRYPVAVVNIIVVDSHGVFQGQLVIKSMLDGRHVSGPYSVVVVVILTKVILWLSI